MRGRLSFALTAFTLLFLLQGWSALLATLFATVYDAVFPQTRASALLPALVPLAALAAPLLPLSRVLERRSAIAVAALLAAVARVPLCWPDYHARLIASAVVVAAGSIFLSHAVGFLERRSVAGGVAAAIVLEQLFRLAGWSWDVSLRAKWLVPQLGIALVVAVIAALWLTLPAPQDDESSLERRAGGLRLRGGLVLALLLFLDLNVLARPEIAMRWLGIRYEVAAVLLVSVSTAAAMLLLASHGPLGRRRGTALVYTMVAAAGVLLARPLGGWPGMALLAMGHGAALLLVGRALVPAGGRRHGATLTIALVLLLVLNALYAFTFFYAFTLPAMRGKAPWLFAAALVLLLMLLVLMPRPVSTRPAIRRKVWVALSLIAAVTASVLLSLRERPARARALPAGTLRVATYNVHYGFDEAWRFDPGRMVDALREAGADIVALQEVTAALPTAYGADLGIYLARRLGMRVNFAPSINGLLGDAVLSRVATDSFASALLPPARADRKQVARLRVPTSSGAVQIFATHFGLEPNERRAQLDGVIEYADAASPAVVLGDLNATDGDAVIAGFASAGFIDAFRAAATPPAPTAPAGAPTQRIDWILVRGADVMQAAVHPSVASDHRLVYATIRLGNR